MATIMRIGGGGVPTSRVKEANTQAEDVLYGRPFVNFNGDIAYGSMPNRGAVSASVGVSGTYTVPKGFHNGSGIVSGPVLNGDASEANVLKNKTFYSNSGNRKTGSMPNNGSVSSTLNPGETYSVPLGYHDGGGTIKARKVDSSDVGTPSASEYENTVSNDATTRGFDISVTNGGVYVIVVTLLEYKSYGSVGISLTSGATVKSYNEKTSYSDDTCFLHEKIYVVTATSSIIHIAIGRGRKCVYSVTKIG